MANIVKTSEKHEVYFNVFHSECNIYSRFISNIVKTSEIISREFRVFRDLKALKDPKGLRNHKRP
ncbi:MAG: hypothetical protein IJC08_00020 [Bacteroidaceae bacterium]|nr:hypothetical protein [Bacteroidaceae bacterium]